MMHIPFVKDAGLESGWSALRCKENNHRGGRGKTAIVIQQWGDIREKWHIREKFVYVWLWHANPLKAKMKTITDIFQNKDLGKRSEGWYCALNQTLRMPVTRSPVFGLLVSMKNNRNDQVLGTLRETQIFFSEQTLCLGNFQNISGPAAKNNSHGTSTEWFKGIGWNLGWGVVGLKYISFIGKIDWSGCFCGLWQHKQKVTTSSMLSWCFGFVLLV